MKRIVFGIATAMLLLSGTAAVYAERMTETEIGVKLWYNTWESKHPEFGTSRTDYTMLIGPAVNVKFPNRLFLDGSFLFSTSDYTFRDLGDRWSRQDLELAFGYMIVDEFGLLAGYKSVWLEEQHTGIDQTLYGPMLGAVFNAPVNQPFSIYANLNYLFTTFRLEDGGDFTEYSPGWIGEIGVKYVFTSGFAGTLGYKYETTKGQDTEVRDTFSGPTFAALFRF